MWRFVFLAVVLVLLGGCGAEAPPSSPVYTVRFLASVPSEPGKPLIPPGSELSRGSECKSYHSAYVWFEILKDGQVHRPSMQEGVSATITLSSGKQIKMVILPSQGSHQLLSIPTGFKEKAQYADLEIYYSNDAKPIGTFRIEKLAEPTLAIQPDEPRMAKPRWRVSVSEMPSGFTVKLTTPRKDTRSVVHLNRATYLDQSQMDFKHPLVFPMPQNHAARFMGHPLDAAEVELEETEYGYETETQKLTLTGLELEEAFDTPVIHIRSDIRFKLKSGVEVTFPKQRLAPLRAGRGPSYKGQLQIRVKDSRSREERAPALPINLNMSIHRVTPDLGAHGIREIQLMNEGEAIQTGRTIRFSTKGELKPGKLPPVTFEVSVQVPKVVGTYKGIVPVERD